LKGSSKKRGSTIPFENMPLKDRKLPTRPYLLKTPPVLNSTKLPMADIQQPNNSIYIYSREMKADVYIKT
jgi:hypothetical protein